jgi:glucosylceramidase
VVVDTSKKFQEILGFGGAFTDAACYTFSQLPADSRAKLFDTLFSQSNMGLSVCRTCIGSSDYSTHAYTLDDAKEPDPDLKHFSIDDDRKYILPILVEARKVNPDLFLFSSPWSPPGWMKSNGSILGGSMRRQYMPSYANYFAKFLKEYEAAGVPIQAVTIQNEVDTDQDGKMPACIWPQEYEVDFVRHQLGPLLKKDGIKTQIWLIDHNYNLWGRALASLETPDLRQYATAIAWHGYVGDPSRMSTVHDAYPDIDMYWTEGGPDYTDTKYATDWTKWSKTFTGNLRNWCRSITVWNLALDEAGKPNIGPFPCGGLVTMNSKTKEISYSGQYWAIAQFSKYIHRGARRIDSQTNLADLDHIAFINPDGQKVLVLTNAGPERTLSVQCGADRTTNFQLEPDSVTTLVWN